ncbi:hypothetical protein [Enterobacter sp. SA187]|uniref:hypothetical protein n=1 Tax=Enterobacter sp. SA187 TaxID=1914861 RepID=UPI000AF42AD1|nr:hypothetical protein [Enterobacter sp. SA187]
MRMNAKELIADSRVTALVTPPAAAKSMTAVADRLDVQFAALCESRNEAKQLTGENAVKKSEIKIHSDSLHFCMGCGKDEPCSTYDVCYALEKTPTSDAVLGSWCAETAGLAVNLRRIHINHQAPVIENVTSALEQYVAQLRCESAFPVAADKPPIHLAITPLTVEHDQYGYWTKPVYDEFYERREYISNEELNAWMNANDLRRQVVYRDKKGTPQKMMTMISQLGSTKPCGSSLVLCIHSKD